MNSFNGKFMILNEVLPMGFITSESSGLAFSIHVEINGTLYLNNLKTGNNLILSKNEGYVYSHIKHCDYNGGICICWNERPSDQNQVKIVAVLINDSGIISLRTIVDENANHSLTYNEVVYYKDEIYVLANKKNNNNIYSIHLNRIRAAGIESEELTFPHQNPIMQSGRAVANGDKLQIVTTGETGRYSSGYISAYDREKTEHTSIYSGSSTNYIRRVILFKGHIYVIVDTNSTNTKVHKVNALNQLENIYNISYAGAENRIGLSIYEMEGRLLFLTQFNAPYRDFNRGYAYDFYDGDNFTGGVKTIDDLNKLINANSASHQINNAQFFKGKDREYIIFESSQPRIYVYELNNSTLKLVYEKSIGNLTGRSIRLLGIINDIPYYHFKYSESSIYPQIGDNFIARFNLESLQFEEQKISIEFGSSSTSITLGNIIYFSTRTRLSSLSGDFRDIIIKFDQTRNRSFIYDGMEYNIWIASTPIEQKITPTMTKNVEEFGVVSASSSWSDSSQPWHAFDANPNTFWMTATSTLIGWLKYKFPIPKIVRRYAITATSTNLDRLPKNWTLEGSNNDVGWEIIDTRLNVSWEDSEKKVFAINNSVPFSYYRINISSNNGNAYNLSIGELEMFELIESNGSWQTISTTLPSEEQFQNEGMDDLSILDRKLTDFEQPMTPDGELGDGKVFKSNVNLRRLFEIKNIKVRQ